MKRQRHTKKEKGSSSEKRVRKKKKRREKTSRILRANKPFSFEVKQSLLACFRINTRQVKEETEGGTQEAEEEGETSGEQNSERVRSL